MFELNINKVAFLVALFFLYGVNSNAQVKFLWHDYSFELKAISPGHYYAIDYMQKDILQKNISKPFSIFDGSKILTEFDEREVVYYTFRNNGAFYNISIDPKQNVILPENYNSISKNLKPGDALIFNLSAEKKKYSIRVQLPYADLSYTPQFYVIKYGLNQLFNYQVISSFDGSKVLKIDTANTSNKKIIDGYKNLPHTKIFHIPEFSTSQNFINESDSTIEVVKKKLKLHPVKGLDYSYLADVYEPQDFLSKPTILKWSRMNAAPDGPTYSRKYARSQAQHNFVLDVENAIYPVVNARVTFINNDGLNDTYYIKDSSQPLIEPFLNQIDPFSVIVDRLVILDKQNNRKIYVPQAFVYNFE